MVVVATTSNKRAESGNSGIGSTAIDLIKTHKHHLKLHVRFCLVLLLLLGVLATVPTEFFVEVSVLSGISAATTESSLSANALRAVQRSEELKAASTNVSFQEPFVQDVVVLPEELLLLVRLPDTGFRFSGKDTLSCLFHRNFSTSVQGVEYIQGRAAVRCGLSESTALNKNLSVSNVVLKDLQTGAEIFPSEGIEDKNWGALVFELWATEKDVVLFAKGINTRRGRNVNASELQCVFDGGVYETRATVSAQEVFRCEHPPKEVRAKLVGRAATLRWEGELVATVAYYEERSGGRSAEEGKLAMCACTVIYDAAKFLREWIMYHTHIGVENFVFYDNNSDDDLDEILYSLRENNFAVSKYPWPWPKTQEAGFSHCALSARHVCQWMLFTDVDEFLFPAAWIAPPQTAEWSPLSPSLPPPLHRMVTALTSSSAAALPSLDLPPTPAFAPPLYTENGHPPLSIDPEPPVDLTAARLPLRRQRRKNLLARNVGQISVYCHDFGPSGLTQHPLEGVTQGYTCRTRRGKRHKSIVNLDALPDELLNVVHHFELKPGYRSQPVGTASAVVNHYKYQAWPEFRRKFRRRVSAYVADWKEDRNLKSKDRAPGLGFREAKPPAWESSFCDVPDTALRDYVHRVFAVNVSGELKLAWQL